MRTKKIGMLGIGLAVVAAFSAIVMLLWNTLIPGIFGLNTINFWQAAGLFILARILFGSFWGRHAAGFNHMGLDFHHDNPLHEKWMKMSPEERKEFIKKRRNYMRHAFFKREDIFSRDFNFNTSDDSKETNKE